MRVMAILAAVAVLFAAGSCVDNEITFFIDHVKTQPSPPSCEYSTGDPWASYGVVDLAFRNPYHGALLVVNQSMTREDYDNLKAESNGILVEGQEASLSSTEGAAIASTEFFEIEHYVPPQSEDVMPAILISQATVNDMAASVGCPDIMDADFLNSAILGEHFGTVYAVVRFIGHTQGGKDVETQEYTFPINVCCGCLIQWSNCLSQCEAVCSDPEEHDMCTLGIGAGGELFDCRNFYYNPGDPLCAGC